MRAGLPEPDVCPFERPQGRSRAGPEALAAQLAEARFDARMQAARAVVLAVAELRERSLAGSLAFEVATRSRQAGVPCYAVTARNRLSSFDARVLDLQAVLEADTPAGLARAARRLAGLI